MVEYVDGYVGGDASSVVSVEDMENLYKVLINHYTEHFGELICVWGNDELGELGFLVCKLKTYDSSDDAPLYAYVTVGLSAFDYVVEEGALATRHEYIMLSSHVQDEEEDEVAPILIGLASLELDDFETFSPNDVINFEEPLNSFTDMEQLLIMTPSWLPAEAAILPTFEEASFNTKLRWVVPLHNDEMEVLRSSGPEGIGELLTTTQPDISDFSRFSTM